MGPCK